MSRPAEGSTAVREILGRVVEAITVRTVFGEPITRDGLTVIPAARVRGTAGAGGVTGPALGRAPTHVEATTADAAAGKTISGTTTEGKASAAEKGEDLTRGGEPSGSGGGLALSARPVGVFVIKDGDVKWRPSVDVNRVIVGGQAVGVVALLTIRALVKAWMVRAARR